ncbi:pre-tRNA nuclear export protein [Malassezia vespertilionis]|uniref:Exportin-T n=1 Tax=Malassezia vespertilionis TaxID=2020962 RepID=A0A2N1JDI4_9BASI|nr:pre-tRNA nuclear export protein [Malassezia vespertilionis]PKI84603.1 Los1p [Malassezia vespertilionis]WFD06439.1 pre-tRNA nuclear export protein [Malassezia vespertilionis]
MDSQEEQLVQAVDIASNASTVSDAGLVSQALAYLEQLKQNTEESWNTGWAIWTARTDDRCSPKWSHAARLFGLNLVDDFLDKRYVALLVYANASVHQLPNAPEALSFLQESALSYLQSEFVLSNGENGLSFMKNKLAQTLSLLVLQTYSLSTSYSFFSVLLALCTTYAPAQQVQNGTLNAISTDLVMRVLHDLSLSLGSDVALRSVRSKERLQRDSAVRDEIRANHAMAIADLLWKIAQDALQAMESSNGQDKSEHYLTPSNAGALAQLSMAVVGDYVSWIDISLIINVHTVPLLFQALHSQHMQLRCVTSDTLCDVLCKGMKPGDKLSMIKGLNMDDVVSSLERSTRSAPGASGEAQAEFREHLAKLLNATCTELVKIAEDASDAEMQDMAHGTLLACLQTALAFLADEYDEPTEQLLPCVHLVLGLYKKNKRQGENVGVTLSPAQTEFVVQLIALVLHKFKFDSEIDWQDSSLVGGAASGGDDDDEEDDEHLVKSLELRKQLQVTLGALAAIHEPLVLNAVQSLVFSTLAAVGQQDLPWEQAELCLYVIYCCGEILHSVRGNKVGLGPHSFVQVPQEPGKSRNVRQSIAVYQSLPPNQLGEMLERLFHSSISTHPHPVVVLQYFECIVRYSSSFLLWPDLIPEALSVFLGERGLRNPHVGMRRRINYLFYRFVRDTRTAVPSAFVPKVLEGMQEAFVINAVLPSVTNDEDPLSKATEKAGAFDSQLYLFDTAGLLIAQLGAAPETQVMLFKAITIPLSEQLQQAVQQFGQDTSNLQTVLQVHHLTLALSTLAKGFPDYDPARATIPAWIPEFKPVTEQILMALTALNQFLIVREASRGAFARIVASAGPAVLPYIPTLTNALVNQVTEAELVDLVGFFGLIIHKYKENVHGVVDDLFFVLVNRIFSFLNQGVQGTDDLVRRSDTERAYFGLINALLSAGLDRVLLSEKNQQQLQTVLQSLVYYAENGEAVTQRSAIGVLVRLVALWGRSSNDTQAGLPGFEQFMYTAMLPIVFQVPSKASFDTSDAQSQLVLSELSVLLKTMCHVRKDEFIQYLTGVYLPRVQCPPELAMELAQNILALEAKPLKRYLETFIAKSRGA